MTTHDHRHAARGAHHAASQDHATAHAAHANGPAGDAAARRMAERRNIEMGTVNHQHSDGHDFNRVLVHGHRVHALRKTGIYATSGGGAQLLGHADAHEEVRVNAGEICHLPLPDEKGTIHKRTCVLAFAVNGHSGWVAVDDLEHHAELAAIQRTFARRIDGERKDGHDKFHPPQTVQPRPAPAAWERLFTYPHQPVGGGANKPAHYFERPGGVVNLLDNIPNTGGSRFGVADDVVGPGAQFHRAEGVGEERVFLWEGGAHGKQTHHHITFVYGYVLNAAGEKRFGWMNVACLAP